jgi:hypothetical protein
MDIILSSVLVDDQSKALKFYTKAPAHESKPAHFRSM